MGDGAEHVEDQFARRRGSIDLFLEAEQGDAADLQLLDDRDEFRKGATVFLVAQQPVSYAIGVITLVLLLAGYGAGRLRRIGRAGVYIETICLSLTAFLLMLPTLTETLRRVPDGHLLVTDLNSPILLAPISANPETAGLKSA